jgi:hypothetical protein
MPDPGCPRNRWPSGSALGSIDLCYDRRAASASSSTLGIRLHSQPSIAKGSMPKGPRSSRPSGRSQRARRKHHWNQPRAGFVRIGPADVGKCPSTMTLETALALLQRAVPWFPSRWQHSYPKRLYAVFDGVVYRATPTVPGVSYHGFPEHPAQFATGGNANEVKRQLLERASETNCEVEVRAWMNW